MGSMNRGPSAEDRTSSLDRRPGLVLVHGTAAGSQQWAGIVPELAERYTIVTPDYSGSGHTTDLDLPLQLDDVADEMLAEADAAGLTDFHLVGHSLGAVVAADLAARYPTKVRSLIMHAGWVHTDARMAARFQCWLDLLDVDQKLGSSLFAHTIVVEALGPRYWENATKDSHEELVTALAQGLAPATDRHVELDLQIDIAPLLARIVAPTLLIASAWDEVVPATQQRALQTLIAGARIEEIDTGHGATAEDPAAFTSLLVDFIDEQERRRPAIVRQDARPSPVDFEPPG
jgi:pimeloyl-ACP methyl ester carboxylesterase